MSTAGQQADTGPAAWRAGRPALLLYLLVAGAVVANLVMRQISGMLGRVEIGGLANTMSVLTAPHVRVDPLREAGTAWAGATPDGAVSAESRQVIADLILWHTRVDSAFVPVYAALLGWLLLTVCSGWRERQRGWRLAALPALLWSCGRQAWWAWAALALAVAADVTENVLTSVFAGRVAEGTDAAGLAGWMLAVTWAKWLALAGVLLGYVHHRFGPEGVVGALRRERPRVWRRHRVQIGVVAVLGILVAVPAGGPLDQVPDILRTYADGEDVRVAEFAWSFLTLGVLCLALWVAGRWALLDGEADASRWPAPRTRWVLLAALALAAVGGLLWATEPGDLEFNAGIFGLPVVLAVLVVLWIPFGRERWRPVAGEGDPKDRVDVPISHREEVRRAGRFLAALPVAIAGLGLVRAFVDPLVGFDLSGPPVRESRIFLGLALAAVFVAAPLVYVLLAVAERWILGDTGDGRSVRLRLQYLVGAAVLLVAAALAGLAAWRPVEFGPRLNATGSVSVFLALVAVLGGALQWLAERQSPYVPTRGLRFRERSPFFVVLAAAFVVAGLLNVQGGYHAMRIPGPADNEAEPLDLEEQFDAWLDQAAGCTAAEPYAQGSGPAVPLVLVVAPGGGIRAAYWTDSALHRLGQGSACMDRTVFAASGVSGGSVGLVSHQLHAADDDPRDGGPVAEMSREEPLAASMAALFFRDLPAGALGISGGWADRAAVLEDAWARSDGDWDSTRLIGGLQPGAVDGAWRPLLLLNGTEVSTGCRLVVSPVRAVASSERSAPRSCLSPAVSGAAHGVVEGAVDLHSFLDGQSCEEAAAPGDIRASTAALLSARFPYVSPSAELFRCEDGRARRAADLDGGAAENSGLATALDLWDALEPLVAQHNGDVVRCRGLSEQARATDVGCTDPAAVVVPLLVLLDNHYASTVVGAPVGRQRELSAPAGLLAAGGVLARQSVLEQEALLTFSGALPGLVRDPDAGPGPTAPGRFVRVAPTIRPGLAAPLGWTLSDLTRDDLDDQLLAALEQTCPHGVPDPEEPIQPLPGRCLLEALGATG
ncbi:hypothetical protein SAMN05660485_03284 [Blastococcus fimeti]|nr:hypothetical protein SAMN05660485_03284 [Blastococcus fimeti]